MEAPAGVGFSYSNTPAVDYVTDDNKTALDNYHFLVSWFGNYSEYQANDFYITYVATDSPWFSALCSEVLPVSPVESPMQASTFQRWSTPSG